MLKTPRQDKKTDQRQSELTGAAAIERLLLDTETLLGVRLAIHDRASIFHGRDGESLLLPSRRYHANSYCESGRFDRAGWDARCKDHCFTAMHAQAQQALGPFTHGCWKGVREIVVPIRREGVHLATLFAGQFRAIGEDTLPARRIDASLRNAWQALPTLDGERAAGMGRVLMALGAGLLALIDQANRLTSPDADRTTRIRLFLHYHAHRPTLRLADLARALDLSPSRTSHLVKELFDQPFQSVLQSERLARARAMLLTSHYPVRVIASRTGFASEYYFSRVFRAAHGMPPAQYRKRESGAAPPLVSVP
jgi:AraC-like DNA-binding protein